jgi:Tfp pilus assembly protein PilX
MTRRVVHNGSALITCILVLVIVSVLAVGLAGVSGVNLQIADNQHQANRAFAGAESGLEVTRYWLGRAKIDSLTTADGYLDALVVAVSNDLQTHGISNFAVSPTGTISVVPLDSLPGYSFQGQWSWNASEPMVLHVTSSGTSRSMSRTISADFQMRPYRFPIFNYGIATQGPMVLNGITSFKGATAGWEADTYIGSDSLLAIDGGKSTSFAGDIVLGSDNAGIDPSVRVDGEVSHLAANEDPPEFPVPKIEPFRQYATGTVYGPGTDWSAITSLTNAVIAAGANPTFDSGGNFGINGILYIEAPNQVMFVGHVNLQGLIVADGALGPDHNDVSNPYANCISFGDPSNPAAPSSFNSGPAPSGAEFEAVRQLEGSCILAPGFRVIFGKNFQSSTGVIAASGLSFDKNISAKIGGTLINYSDEPLTIGQNANMTFDRSAMVEIPAGFDLYRVPVYDPSSYTMAY